MYMVSNPLHIEEFLSVGQMEAEIIRMVINLYRGDAEACGIGTSGGTESIILACLAYREQGRARGITTPNMVSEPPSLSLFLSLVSPSLFLSLVSHTLPLSGLSLSLSLVSLSLSLFDRLTLTTQIQHRSCQSPRTLHSTRLVSISALRCARSPSTATSSAMCGRSAAR